MFAASFMEILIDITVIGFYVLALILALLFVFALVYDFGEWEDYSGFSVTKRFLSLALGLVIAIPLCAFFVWMAITLWFGDPQKTFSTEGGLGPDTVCWYEMTDTDTVVMAGKTPIHIDGEEIRTVCAKAKDRIPEEVKNDAPG